MYCGELGRSPVELFADWMSGSRSRGFARNYGREVIFTQSGRAAIRLAAEVWKIGNDSEVLVPAYNCGSEISPFLGLGAKIKMYRVDKNARIGDGASLTNKAGVDHADGDGYYIREGIVVVPKDGVIRPGTRV